MRFSQYMHEWLYGKEGYYRTFKNIGKEGDFYTAVSASRFFGGSIAKKIIKTIDSGFLPIDTVICEIGAHRGYLLGDIVQFLFTLRPSLLKTLRFVIIEPFERLRDAQRAYFWDSFGGQVALEHYKSLNECSFTDGFVVANEIFDAFACELVYEGKMAYINEGEIEWDQMEKEVRALCDRYNIVKGEVALGYEAFASDLARAFKRYEFVTFDYGEKRHCNDFSIRIYKDHRVYPFFEIAPLKESKTDVIGLDGFYARSDMTYDVCFAHLIGAFEDSGATCCDYKTQAAALVDFGITELLEMLAQKVPHAVYLREANKLKTLLHPSFMGERFKMALFRKVQ